MQPIPIEAIKQTAIERYTGHSDGLHGLSHWERVRENGRRLSRVPGVDAELVEAFAYLHDCCRQDDGSDREHGWRAAQFALSLSGGPLKLSTHRLERLMFACEHHAKGFTNEDPTIGACWDADRLDLGRIGLVPDPQYLSTELARTREVIRWAYQRSLGEDPSASIER